MNPSTGVTLQRATLDSDGTDHGWQIVDMLAFKVGSAEVSGSGRALIDTGATLMYIPELVGRARLHKLDKNACSL